MPLTRSSSLIVALYIFFTASVEAGGPIAFDVQGPFTWDTSRAITYTVDDGPLGTFAGTTAREFARRAFARWAQAATTLRFEQQLRSENIVTAARYLELEKADATGSLVVLDDRGDIVARLTGEQNRQQILGWALPMTNGRRIVRFVSLMNGALTTTQAAVESTMTHEFGHALGLDHAQINAEFANNRQLDDDQFLPTMFPTATDDDSSLVELNPDDVAWIRQLYPSVATRNAYGGIAGRVTRDGKPVLGANVIAIRVGGAMTAPDTPLLERFSCVSDYLGTRDGAFSISVPPGIYTLRVEPVRRGFSGGSSVGPYAETPAGLSFVNPVPTHDAVRTHRVEAGALLNIGTLGIP